MIHTGAMMFMGKGVVVNVSRKHAMNVRTSIKSKLVSIADVLGMIVWCKYFIEAQGYTIESIILYQNNNHTILLAKNSRMSAGKKSKHIKNCFSSSLTRWPRKSLKLSIWEPSQRGPM